MAKKTVESVADGEQFVIRTFKDDGSVKDVVALHSDKPFDDKAIGSSLSREYSDKNVANRRIMHLSTLAKILASPKLDGYMGTADKTTGKAAPEFKQAVLREEHAYIGRLVHEGTLKIPKHEHGDDRALDKFLTEMREDKNYSNVKSWVMKYAAIVGLRPVTPSGFLVPVPVMMAAIENALNKTQEKATIVTMLQDIIDLMGKSTTPADDATKALPLARALHATLEGMVRELAELANVARGTSGEKGIGALEIVAKSDAAIAAAQASAEHVLSKVEEQV